MKVQPSRKQLAEKDAIDSIKLIGSAILFVFGAIAFYHLGYEDSRKTYSKPPVVKRVPIVQFTIDRSEIPTTAECRQLCKEMNADPADCSMFDRGILPGVTR